MTDLADEAEIEAWLEGRHDFLAVQGYLTNPKGETEQQKLDRQREIIPK